MKPIKLQSIAGVLIGVLAAVACLGAITGLQACLRTAEPTREAEEIEVLYKELDRLEDHVAALEGLVEAYGEVGNE